MKTVCPYGHVGSNPTPSDYKKFPKYTEKEGLFVENAHAPYMQTNSIWGDNAAGDEYTVQLIECIRDYLNIIFQL